MKNIFRILMAVAVLFTASCAKEEISSSIGGGEVEVTFTASLPQLGTRAFGDGAKVNTLRYFVYDGDELLTELSSKEDIAVGVPTTVNLVLLKGMTYNIVFWADCDERYAYNETTKSVTVDYVNANDEERDAFYKFVAAFDPANATSENTSIELTRPFAQLNAAVSQSDIDAVNDSQVDLTTSTVELEAYTTLNIATGVVDGKQTVKFAEKDMPKTDFNGYTLLSMNYILVPQDAVNAKMVSDVEFTFKANKNGGVSAFSGTKYFSVPLKRNYRTNILGSLLTKPTDFEVKIEAAFTDDNKYGVLDGKTYIKVNSVEEFNEAFADSIYDMIILDGDIDFDNPSSRLAKPALVVANDKSLTIDLAGHAIKGVDQTTANFSIIDNRGTLTINDSVGGGKILVSATTNSGWNRYSAVIANNPGGVLVVNGGTIEHLGGTDMAYGIDNLTNGKGTSAVTTINGGTVKSPYRAIRQFLNGVEANNSLTINGGTIEGANKSVWMQDPNKNANTGTLVISEDASLIGNVYLTVTSGSTEWPVNVAIADAALKNGATVLSNNVPEGYAVVKENGTWKVVEDDTILTVSTADELRAAINEVVEGGKIILKAGTYEGCFDIKNKSNITILSNNGAHICGMTYLTDSNVKFNGIKFSNPNAVLTIPDVAGDLVDHKVNGMKPCVGAYTGTTVEFTDCKFDIDGEAVYAFTSYASTNATFNGCEFECYKKRPISTNGDNTTVTGCTFNNQYHYSVRIFENDTKVQNVIYTNNIITGANDKGEFEGINISKKGNSAVVLGNFTIKGNTSTLKYRHHKNVTMSDACTYDTDIANFAFEKEQ